MKTQIDLPVEAGIYTEQTARGATNRWKDGDKVRFRYGLVEKLGGWLKINNLFIGLARKLWDWTSLDSRNWVSLGTESKLYLFQGSTLYDITPLRRTQTRTDPLATVDTTNVVTVTDTAHGAQDGDYVNIANAAPVGGITIIGQYRITVVNSNSYTIIDDQTASSTAAGGGEVLLEYDISVGASSQAFGVGWGTGTWSQSTWNTARTASATVISLRTWSLDNWGEDLISNPRGGSLYWWDRNTGPNTRAVILPNAPVNSNYMIISERDRHLFSLGCTDHFTGLFDPLLLRWCSKEDFGDWIPTSVNTSGDLRLYRGSKIEAAVRTRGEILVFTDASVHQINYLGGTAVYGIQTVGENVSILGPNAAVPVDYRVYFMAESDFYIYDGVLRVLPCDVRNYVYENLNYFQKDKAFAGLNREFNEIWFFYPGRDPAVWVEADFATGDLVAQYELQSTAAPKYTVDFNAFGYTEITTDLATNYDLVWIAQSTTAIITPFSMDLEVSFKLNNGVFSRWVGAVINLVDLSGGEDTSGDNVECISIALNSGINFLRMYKRNNGADQLLANGSTGVNLSTLPTPVTLVDDVEYGLTITRTATQVISTLYDPVTDTKQTVETVTLSAGEITQFVASGYGANLGVKGVATDYSGIMQLTGLRAAPAGILTAMAGTGVVTEVNRYVIYNYMSEVWSIGSMERTSWADRSPAFNKPYAAGVDSFLYQHETGNDDDTSAMVSFAETFDMEIPESGEYMMHVDKLIPDFVNLSGTVNLTLKAKKYPQSPNYTVKGPFPVTVNTEKISPRIRGRQIALRVDSDQLGDHWRMGTLRARVLPHGKRGG